jgi:hypothetical protein
VKIVFKTRSVCRVLRIKWYGFDCVYFSKYAAVMLKTRRRNGREKV